MTLAAGAVLLAGCGTSGSSTSSDTYSTATLPASSTTTTVATTTTTVATTTTTAPPITAPPDITVTISGTGTTQANDITRDVDNQESQDTDVALPVTYDLGQPNPFGDIVSAQNASQTPGTTITCTIRFHDGLTAPITNTATGPFAIAGCTAPGTEP